MIAIIYYFVSLIAISCIGAVLRIRYMREKRRQHDRKPESKG